MTRRFDGDVYDPLRDDERLLAQIERVKAALQGQAWITVAEICRLTGDPAPSVLAQIGHLKKRKHGKYLIEKRRRGGEKSSLWEYHIGPRGAGTPRPHTCPRTRELTQALAALDPTHPLLQ